MASIPNQRYHYPKLLDASREIRLLRFLPEKYPGHLALEMTVTYLEEVQGRFAAISYTWGDADDLVPITVDFQQFLITRNGAEALKRVRKHALKKAAGKTSPEPRNKYMAKRLEEDRCIEEAQKHAQARGHEDAPVTLFWMDAACINQQNTKEKEDQVRNMGKIYSAASYVASFVGNSDTLGDLMLAGHVLHHSRGVWVELSATIHAFANLPYFNRMWIVQEMLLAAELWFLCGSDTYLASSVYSTILAIVESQRSTVGQAWLQEVEDTRLFKLLRDKYELRSEGNDLPLVTAVEHYIGGKCGDPKDQIYSLIGLGKLGYQYPVQYSSSNAEVLAHFAVQRCAMSPSPTNAAKMFSNLLDLFFSEREDTKGFRISAASETDHDIIRTQGPQTSTHFYYFHYGQYVEGVDRVWMRHIFVDTSRPSTDFPQIHRGDQHYPLIVSPLKAGIGLSIEEISRSYPGFMFTLSIDPVDFLEALALSKNLYISREVRMPQRSTIAVPASFALSPGWNMERGLDE